MTDNRYIAVEGVIGVGKTSLARLLAERILEGFAVRTVKVRIAKQNLGWTTGGRAVIEVERRRS